MHSKGAFLNRPQNRATTNPLIVRYFLLIYALIRELAPFLFQMLLVGLVPCFILCSSK